MSTQTDDAMYTISSTPPARQRERFSMWEALFDECRRFEGEWRRAKIPMKRSTASQLASDIRNAHLRSAVKSRLKGLKPNERWESAWGEEGEAFYVWIRYVGTVND
jgi:hypothetical protein